MANDEKTCGVGDGGSLYPTDTAAGMSQRDYFASDQTAALLGIALRKFTFAYDVEYETIRKLLPRLVDLGYEAAELMLERRKR